MTTFLSAEEKAAHLSERLRRNYADPDFPTREELDALACCFERAMGTSGGMKRVRDFLLSWQNARELGAFDITEMWELDDSYAADLKTVMLMIIRGPRGFYPSHYGYEGEIAYLVERYRSSGAKASKASKG